MRAPTGVLSMTDQSFAEPVWCSLRGALDWVLYGSPPLPPDIETTALRPAAWPDSSKVGTAKAQILQAIEAGSVAGIDHFALFVDNRDARKFMREKTNDGNLSSVTSIDGVNFMTSRHDGWPDKPQIFVKVSGLKKLFPEPLFT